MVIVFIGPPGCGKGTQAQILKDNYLPNLNILTVSSLLKAKSSDGSVLGLDIKKKMDNGDLIEDQTVISVLKEKVESLGSEDILIDGFPRSSIQAEALMSIISKEKIHIINFEVNDEELKLRIAKRTQEETRADDKVFDKRLGIYKKSHEEIVNTLTKFTSIINITANDNIESITQKIIEKLGLN